MKAPREILFRAKRIDNGKWVEGYYLYYKPLMISPLISDEYRHCITTLSGITVFIDPTTLSQFTGWKDSHGNRIFENDIVEIVSTPKTSYKYLMWWNREMNLMEAVQLESIYFNGADYSDDNPQFTYETFCLMLQDPWGDFKDIKVIGNLFDNYDIIKEALNGN